MKKIFFSLLICFVTASSFAQNVAINTDGTNADASAMLDIKSTSKGMLIPRMSTVQRTSIVSPANGLMVYDTDTKTFWYYNGTAWTNLTVSGGSGSFTLPYNGSTSSSTSALAVVNTGSGAAIEGSGSAGAGIYGNSFNGAGVNALSTNGFGIVANSLNSTSLYSFSNNSLPTTKSINTGTGNGIDATANSGAGLYAYSNTGAGVNALSNNGMGIISNSTNSSAIYGFNANAFSAIKGANSVGDGVRGESSGNGVAGVSGISTAANGYGVWGNSNTGTGVLAQSANGLALNVSGNLKIAGGNTNPSQGAVLTSDANGNAVWKSNRIAFGTEDVNTNFTTSPNSTWRKVHFSPTNYYDFGNNYNLLIGTNVTPTSSAFIAPITGVYHFDALVRFYSFDNPITDWAIRLVINRNGSISTMMGISSYDPAEFIIHAPKAAISRDVYLMAGDIVHVEGVQTNRDAKDASVTSGFFNGHLVLAQ